MKVGDRVVVVGSDLTNFEGVIVKVFPLDCLGIQAYTVDLDNKFCDLNMQGCYFEEDELEVVL